MILHLLKFHKKAFFYDWDIQFNQLPYYFFYRRGKIVSIFGTQALRLCTNMLKMSSDFQELQELVEDVSEKIDINVKVSDI